MFDCILINGDNSDASECEEIERNIGNKMFLTLNSNDDNVLNLRVKSDSTGL